MRATVAPCRFMPSAQRKFRAVLLVPNRARSSLSSDRSYQVRAIDATLAETYKGAVERLLSLQSNSAAIDAWAKARRTDPGAEKYVMEEMQNCLTRANRIKVMHIAGTKGKGSVCSFAASILAQHGLKTGLFTSPHLVTEQITERIQVNGQPIAVSDFARLFWECWDRLTATKSDRFPNMPQFFKFLTLVGLKHFIEQKVDIALIEVGIGGRLDATNVFDAPELSAICPIGYDHMDVLGESLSEIAAEKAGICKPNIPTFTVQQQPPEAMTSLIQHAKLRQSPLYVVPNFSEYSPTPTLGLLGEHQHTNGALAIGMCRAFLKQNLYATGSSSDPATDWKSDQHRSRDPIILTQPYLDGLRLTKWPGRAQILALPSDPTITLYLDGAHTRESLAVASTWFGQACPSPSRVLVFYCKQNRDPRALLGSVVRSGLSFSHVIFSTETVHAKPSKDPNDTSGIAWQQALASTWRELGGGGAVFVTASVSDALQTLSKLPASRPLHVFVTGSLYLVGAALKLTDWEW